MNPQITTALLIVAGAGLSTMLLFSIIHTSFRSALMPKTVSNSVEEAGPYVGRIY